MLFSLFLGCLLITFFLCFPFQAPQLVQGLASRNIVKIAAHSDGHHYLALAATGEVYSWGCGDGGRLGHGDTVYVRPLCN